MKKFIAILFTYFGLLVFFSIFSVGLFTSLGFLALRKGVSESRSSAIYNYQILHLKKDSNKPSFGTVSISERLSEEDFLSYHQKSGDLVLISNFGSDEYVCSGHCFCEVDSRRVTSTMTFSRAATFLVAGVSSIVAYKKAREYFDNSCKNEFEGDACTHVKAVVDNCDDVSEAKPADHSLDKSSTSTVDRNSEKYRRYYCYGNCLSKEFNTKLAKSLTEEIKCETLELGGQVEFEATEGTDSWRTAAKLFQATYLRPFCENNSKVGKDRFLTDQVIESGISRNVVLCQSSNPAIVGGDNKSITCRKTYPEEFTTNME